ncbi:MAG: zinc-binding dehydrogenase [Candidatus Dormibacterales bacterium]
MLALVAAPDREDRITFAEVADPEPGPGEVLVQVRAVSLNRGEVNRLATAEAGWRPGWDVAGTVLRPAADGSGPPAGARVVALRPAGAWCERVPVPSSFLAVLPDGVGFAAASTFPVAGLTALRALRVPGSILGRTVLVSGAAGGVGRYAVQLAARAGAEVTALVGRPERSAGLRELGAGAVAVGYGELGERRFDVILESAGGADFEAALKSLARWGTLVTFGNSARERSSFLVNDLYSRGGCTVYGFFLFAELERQGPAADLAFLAGEVEAGRLDPQVGLEADWREAGRALLALRDRSVAGKAVLHLGE